MKTCSECRQVKSLASFPKDATRKDGLNYKCRVCLGVRRRRDYVRNYERETLSNSAWRTANRGRHAEATTNWRKNNPERYRAAATAKVARRKRGLVVATPPWADLEAIRKKYLVAKILGFEVDHIVPLRSKIVCGLHVVANLQVIPEPMNRDKSNRTWPNMPEAA